MKNKLLVVSWAMPPLAFPRSIQVSRLLAELSTLGWDITVLSSNTKELEKHTDDSLKSFYQTFYKIVTIPTSFENARDGDVLMSQWLNPAVNVAENLLKENEFDLLITFAQPWVDHLIGLELTKQFPIPWIAHFSDPWVDSIYYSKASSAEISEWRKLERKIIEQAHTVVWTNKQAQKLVMSKYPPSLQLKCKVTPHCFDPKIFESITTTTKSVFFTNNSRKRLETPALFSKKKCRLVYTGDFYGPRSPEPLFNGLKKLWIDNPDHAKNLSVVLIGSIPQIYEQMIKELKINKTVKILPKATYMDSLSYANFADALLLVDSPSTTSYPYLPSKLIDYLMFMKPIVGITPLNGAPADVLRALDCLIADPKDINAIYDILLKIIELWKQKKLKVNKNFIETSSIYTMEAVGSEFNDLIEETIEINK
jgi:glycosyltransferase involved in cell wall biosynthesis